MANLPNPMLRKFLAGEDWGDPVLARIYAVLSADVTFWLFWLACWAIWWKTL